MKRSRSEDHARGKAWEAAKKSADRLDRDQKRMLIRKLIADMWMQLEPMTDAQEELKRTITTRARKLMEALDMDLRDLEQAVKSNNDKRFLRHLKVAKHAGVARGAWALKAARVLAKHPEHAQLAEDGLRLCGAKGK